MRSRLAALASTLTQDVRYAWRTFVRQPAFAAVVIVTLALAIGANTAIVSVVYAVLVRPLPYAQPDRIYSAEIVLPERRDQIPSLLPTVQTFLRWRTDATTAAELSALTPWEASLTGDGEPERVGGARVSTNFFSFLGVAMTHGRGFIAQEEEPGQSASVVISDGLWRRRYGADPAVVGRRVVINGDSYVIVGIAPASLVVPTRTQLHAVVAFAPRVDIWKPIAPTARELRNESWDHGVLVRLREGSTADQGRQELAAIVNRMVREQMPDMRTQATVQLIPVRELYAANIRLRLLLVLAASALLLLTACVSVANVFLARVASRAHELATRVALGASRARILGQTLTETVTLAVLGGAAGAVIARYGASLLAAYGPDDLQPLAGTPLQVPLLLVAIAVSTATGVACGIVPAWQASRQDPGAELQDAGRTAVGGRRAGRVRQWLVAVEMALATLLLASAGLLLHSFVKVMSTDRGYQIARVLTADLSLFGQRYAAGAGRVAFYRQLVDNIRALPGVAAAGAINNLPAVSASDGASRTIFYPTDADFQRLVLARPVAMIRSVTAGYFAASGTTLRAGRFLTDEETALTAVVSESLVRRLWPGEATTAVLGRQFRQGGVREPLVLIAGVVADAQPGGLDREPPPAIYRPYGQWASGPMTLVIRTAQQPSTLAAAVRAEVRRLDPDLPIASMRTMSEIVSSTVAQRRFQLTLTSLFALVALLLGTLGVYGVVSYAVACRTREIGLRIALGALRADVVRWVFGRGMWPVVAGLAAGLVATVAVARGLRAVLFGVAPADPLSLGAVVVVLASASALACYLPARRAAAVDPIVALRHE